jgi:hypothetical protein
MRRFAKPLYGLTPVPRVRIPASPPHLAIPITYAPIAVAALQSAPQRKRRLVSQWCPLQKLFLEFDHRLPHVAGGVSVQFVMVVLTFHSR